MTTDALLIGCGALGSDVGRRLADLGHAVTAVRRRAEDVPAPLRGIGADLTQHAPDLSDTRPDLLVVALTARPRTEESYRATYVDGVRRALDALDVLPRRAVFVSSTAVYGGVDAQQLSVEETPTEPTDGPARMLVEAEDQFLQRLPHGTVLRLSGLYGHSGRRLLDQVREGRVTDPDRWTNRIHRDDAAAAVVHLLCREEHPERLYIGTDDEPARLGDVATYIARCLDAPAPPAPGAGPGHGKRLSNARLRASGWTPAFPTFREGYADAE